MVRKVKCSLFLNFCFVSKVLHVRREGVKRTRTTSYIGVDTTSSWPMGVNREAL